MIHPYAAHYDFTKSIDFNLSSTCGEGVSKKNRLGGARSCVHVPYYSFITVACYSQYFHHLITYEMSLIRRERLASNVGDHVNT